LLAGHPEENRNPSIAPSRSESMILKKPAPDLIRGGSRFSEKIVLS